MSKSFLAAVVATTLAASLSFGDSFEEEIERVEQQAEVLLTKIKGTVKDSAEYRALVEEFRELLKPREISGTKTLEEVFRDWHFAKVYEVADDGLAFRFRRDTRMVWTSRREPHMNRTRVRPESVTIVRKGETEGFGSEMQGVTVGFESELFPVEGCSWLSNSTRKVYLRLSRHHEFSRLSLVDRFVVALDLQKAYSVESKQDVPCPIPFVNDEPDFTEEELHIKQRADRMLEFAVNDTNKWVKSCSPIVPHKIYSFSEPDKEDGGIGRSFVVFDEQSRPSVWAEFLPRGAPFPDSLAICRYDYERDAFYEGWIHGKTAERFLNPRDFIDHALALEILRKGIYSKDGDPAHQHEFVQAALAELKLTAADFPGSGFEYAFVKTNAVAAVEPLAKVLSLGFSEMVRTNDCALTVKFRDKEAEFLHLTHVRSNGALVSSPVVPGSRSVMSTNELMIVAGPDTTLSLRILPREELMKSCSALVADGGPWFAEVVFEPEEIPPRVPSEYSVQPPSQKFLIDLRDGTSYSLQDGSDTKGFLPFRQADSAK